MKITREEFEKAIAISKRGKRKKKQKSKFQKKEIGLLVKIFENLPENVIRHLNYEKVREEMKKISEKDIAEKILIREIVDRILSEEK